MSQFYTYFDIAGGADNLSGYAFPAIHKFNASGFYNWEEDNLPINDLETRSDVFKQYLGLNTSLTGVTLTVSADAPKSASATGVYQTIQEALEVVPRRLTFPLLIEICDFGDLGDLNLADIHAEGDGGLQIVCRQYAEAFAAEAGGISSVTTYGPSATQALPTVLSSNTEWTTQVQGASSVKLALNCSASEPWNRHARVYLQKTPDSQSEPQLLGFSPFPRQTDIVFSSTIANQFNFLGYNTNDEATVADDVNPGTYNGNGTSLITERLAMVATNKLSAFAYGAYFRKIKITNCSRVKLQNICVDSASGADFNYPNNTQYLCDRGIDVRNSNILLENVAVSRVKKIGLYLENSNVSVSKSLVIHRVYECTVNQTRPSEGVGVYASDSVLAFDTSGYTDGGWSLNSISKCGTAIQAINSTIAGGAKSEVVGVTYPKNAGGLDTQTSHLYLFGSQTGFDLTNSVFDYDGRPEIFCNIKGIAAFQSTIVLPQFSIDDNQEEGVGLNKSIFKYGKFATSYFAANGSVSGLAIADLSKPGYSCDYNGINLHADKGSAVMPVEECSAIANLDMWGGSWSGSTHGGAGQWAMASHGCEGTAINARVPAIVISENSNAELSHLAVAGDGTMGGVAGMCTRAAKNSNLTLRGSSKSATCLGSYGSLASADSLKMNWTTAAAAADDNSTLVFTGPTKIARYGISVLAQNNSKMNFVPPTVGSSDFVPDIARFGLDSSSNHTMIDLHSSRACLVANNKSTINMQSLGGSSLSAVSSVDSQENFNYSSLFVEATSGSFVRFSPNGFTQNSLGSAQVEADNFDLFTRSALSGFITSSQHPLNSTGGMCIRAVGASNVNANLVNFQFGCESSSVSGVVYNWNGTGCEYDGTQTSGIVASPTTNICDLVTSCCTTYTTSYTPTTSTSTTTTSTTTTSTNTLVTVTPPTDSMHVVTYDVDGKGMANANLTNTKTGESYNTSGLIEFSCVGSRVHMWNIADTSRVHVSNLLINRLAPETACVGSTWHGPTGRWYNGAACDYYGNLGFASVALSAAGIDTGHINRFYNLGIFRILGSHRGYLKTYSEVDYDGFPILSQWAFGGGSPLDQCGSQGYQTMFDAAVNTSGAEDTVAYHVGLEYGTTSGTEPVFGRGIAGQPGFPGKINGIVTHAAMTEGLGMLWDMGQLHPQFPIPPLHLGWQGYLRNWVDESAASVFANARHSANKKVNLLSIYRSTVAPLVGGEGRDTTTGEPTFGVGVRSLNMFDLNRLV